MVWGESGESEKPKMNLENLNLEIRISSFESGDFVSNSERSDCSHGVDQYTEENADWVRFGSPTKTDVYVDGGVDWNSFSQLYLPVVGEEFTEVIAYRDAIVNDIYDSFGVPGRFLR